MELEKLNNLKMGIYLQFLFIMKFQNYGNYKLYIIYYIFYTSNKILKKKNFD